jgi:hypothetical protein
MVGLNFRGMVGEYQTNLDFSLYAISYKYQFILHDGSRLEER